MSKYQSINFNVSGMHCTACANRLEKKLSDLQGIYKSSVNFATNSAIIEFQPSVIKEEDIIAIANTMGYSLTPEYQKISDNTLIMELIQVSVSWIFSIILILPMFFHSFHGFTYLGIIIAGATIFIPGFTIIKSAISSLTSGIMGMDVLIALGALAAWISSLLPIVGIDIPDYSMTASMLISVNLTGRLIENWARGSASKAVEKLAQFTGTHAEQILDDGSIKQVSVKELKIEDIIQIKAGEKIPTDGTILEGQTSTEESFLTGESLPVDKKVGDYVYGGSINLDGFIKIKVEKDATNNILAQTIKLIQEAQGTKVPIQILADNITTVFVPIILTLSFLSFALWFAFPNFFPDLLHLVGINIAPSSRLAAALSAAIAVLVIACPCALGLATPMALVNGSTLGATKGILIRKGKAIQNLCDIDIIGLDKTGTLTIGKPKVKSIITDQQDENLLPILVGLENSSTHPLAQAVLNHAKEHNISGYNTENIKNIPGQGIFGTHLNQEWFAGSLKATKEHHIIIPEKMQEQMHERLELGETLICLSNTTDNQCKLIISFADSLNVEAIESIQQLKNMKKKIIMITGDHKQAAHTIAKELDIASVMSECSPKQKLETIKSLQNQGYKVCFVGDGINDAAALEQANVGIAMGTGTNIASESGDVILVHGSLKALVTSFKLAQAIFKKIKQNLFWAFFYNVTAIPLAFLGLLHPIVAEIAMSISSLTVIANSLLLKKSKID